MVTVGPAGAEPALWDLFRTLRRSCRRRFRHDSLRGVRRQTEEMRKQYHFWPGEGGLDAWDVDHLIRLSADLPVEEVALSELPEIDCEYWFDEWERPTVRKVVEHFRLVRDVDSSYPIILGPDNRVMDGMHRVARALLDGSTAVTAKRLRELPEPDYRGCRPDELPY
jgi:hypothetical protein